MCVCATITKHLWEKLLREYWVSMTKPLKSDGSSDDHMDPENQTMLVWKGDAPWFDGDLHSLSLKTCQKIHQIDCNFYCKKYQKAVRSIACFLNNFWQSQLDRFLPHISTQWIWSVVVWSPLRFLPCFQTTVYKLFMGDSKKGSLYISSIYIYIIPSPYY